MSYAERTISFLESLSERIPRWLVVLWLLLSIALGFWYSGVPLTWEDTKGWALAFFIALLLLMFLGVVMRWLVLVFCMIVIARFAYSITFYVLVALVLLISALFFWALEEMVAFVMSVSSLGIYLFVIFLKLLTRVKRTSNELGGWIMVPKRFLLVGIVLLLVATLFPPWKVRMLVTIGGARMILVPMSAGYAPLFNPPETEDVLIARGLENYRNRELTDVYIDLPSLIVEYLAIGLFMAAVVLAQSLIVSKSKSG